MTTPWLFAASAVLYVLWSGRRPPAAGVPALPPIGLPGLAPPVTLAGPAAGGVSPLLVGAILVPWALLAWTHSVQPGPTPAPGPEPTPASGLDLRGKFVGEHAAEDAAITATLLSALADAIQFDGTLGEPRLRTGQQLAELRSTAREYRTEGVRLGDRQPLARDAIATFLEGAVGTDGGPIDAAARTKWIDAFRGVSRAASAAIGR